MAQVARSSETIAAIATALGEGAIGILRLSGPEALRIVDEIFVAKNHKSLLSQKTFTFRYGWVVRDKDKSIVDEVVVALMRAPQSYTREDVVEIHAHGGIRATQEILSLVLARGARLAEPGEFTKRAFLNGRIDLVQAEAVLDVIQAKTDLALASGEQQLSGVLSRSLRAQKDLCVDLLADMEAEIDFPDEEIGKTDQARYAARLGCLVNDIAAMIETGLKGRVIREGLKVALFGRPNTGKSSLLNALVRAERAIVTPVPGTTRDTVEEYISINGLAVHLIDTAGILESPGLVEKEALNRAHKAVDAADLVLFVVDGSQESTDEDAALARKIASKKVILVVNKIDLGRRFDRSRLGALTAPEVEVSALKSTNIRALEEVIHRAGTQGVSLDTASGALVTNMRHIDALKRVNGFLTEAASTLGKGISLEFVAADVRRAVETFGEITGEVLSEDILNVIFSKFCIGK